MSEQARTVFDIEEQKAKDVLAAIKVVKSVLPIIREWGKKEEKYKNLSTYNQKLSEQIRSINLTIAETDNRHLYPLLKDKNSEYDESSKREAELKCICDNLEGEVFLYQKYAKIFSWIDKSIIEKVLNLNNFKDKEEYLSMMFLLLNADISEYNLKPMNQRSYYYIGFTYGWNWMLNKLKQNEI